jgi:siroheme synthase
VRRERFAVACQLGLGEPAQRLAGVERRAREPGDDAVRLAEGDPQAHEQVGEVGCRDQLV